MQWNKQRQIFTLPPAHHWIKSHAQVPTVLVKSDRLRVYFATRPQQGLSLTTYVDLDLEDFSQILYLHEQPLLEQGSPGTFDEHGIMPASVLEKDGLVYLYYSGWSQSVGVPYNNYTGVAISEDGGQSFKKYSQAPIIDRTLKELYSATSPCVRYEEGLWHMWYCSGTHWHQIGNNLEHTYDIKYAQSSDGLNWEQSGQIAIVQQDAFEAITRPTVLKLDEHYHMWYCYRGSQDFRDGQQSYRIGYAQSNDLQHWQRMDQHCGLNISDKGWDSHMVAYPEVFELQDEIYLFYNGNGFGQQGFGYAELERRS